MVNLTPVFIALTGAAVMLQAGVLLAMVIALPLGAFPLNRIVPTRSVPPEKKFGK